MANEKEKAKLLQALVEKPTVYHIEITDNSMVPKSIGVNAKIFKLEIKPPSMYVLSLCALPVLRIPEDIRTNTKTNLEEALKYVDEMLECITILAFQTDKYEPWRFQLLKKNLSPKEVFLVFTEVSSKLQTDFFLSSFQSANENPILIPKMNV